MTTSTQKTTTNNNATIKVYRDHESWDKHEKWFMMPSWLLNDLYVCTYDCNDEMVSPSEIRYVEREHPGCVFIY